MPRFGIQRSKVGRWVATRGVVHEMPPIRQKHRVELVVSDGVVYAWKRRSRAASRGDLKQIQAPFRARATESNLAIRGPESAVEGARIAESLRRTSRGVDLHELASEVKRDGAAVGR